jgi:hypothetical protein
LVPAGGTDVVVVDTSGTGVIGIVDGLVVTDVDTEAPDRSAVGEVGEQAARATKERPKATRFHVVTLPILRNADT